MPEREKTQPKYATEARGNIVRGALQLLNLTQVAAIRRLNNRPSDAFVSLWCSGKRAIPQWAAAVLASDMRSQAVRLTKHAEDLERIATVGRSGNGRGHALMAWRLHRLAQKEKAGD